MSRSGRLAGPLDQIIDGLQRKYSKMQAISADFVQIYQGQDGQTLRESGHVILRRPRKARWDYYNPERKVFVSDGRNVYFYVYGEREATSTSISESSDPQIPFLFLLGQGNLRRDFSSISIAQEPVFAQGDLMLKLVPKHAPEDFKQLLVEISPGSLSVSRLVIFQRNGSRMDFILSNTRENAEVPGSAFQFAPPAGVAIRKLARQM